ncbi:MAG: substrate-binding domain-containing protein [Coriobacteriia bacterium]
MTAYKRISESNQLAALADPQRLAILRHLMNRPATLTHLATAFDSYPAQVRYHVKQLEAVGLIRLQGTKTTRNYTEKFYEATADAFGVHMLVLPGDDDAVTILASKDKALTALAELAEPSAESRVYSPASIGSLDGLIALRQGLADIAGCHLFDAEGEDYNVPFIKRLFPDRDMTVVTLAHREQGFVVREGNPRAVTRLEDLAQSGVRIVNRDRASGVRSWLDAALRRQNIAESAIDGYLIEACTQNEGIEKVASGAVDVALGTRTTAAEHGLDFVPLFVERYDLVMDASRINEPEIERLLDTLCTRAFKTKLDECAGYDSTDTGNEVRVAV